MSSQLTESRKVMGSKNHVCRAITRYEFQREVNVQDPYAKLAAAVILQMLLDAVNNLDFGTNDRVYDVLSEGIGLKVPYEELRDRMLIRKYVLDENIPTTATAWIDHSLRSD